jgi:ADP-ribose pyrophosphatase YjhB (NUDIX family)
VKYCNQCGARVSLFIPVGDNKERHVCRECDTIHYENPRVITGTLPVFEDSVLLCRRAIEPRRGLWTLPAGFMENGESTEQGAIRETLEEANAQVSIDGLYCLFDLPQFNQVYTFYRAQLLDLKFYAGDESLEVALFKTDDIPWQQLAFSVVSEALKLYIEDRKNNHYPVRSRTIRHHNS